MASSIPVSAAHEAGHSSTGYGPSSNAAAVLPVFDGNKKSFRDFDFKLKAVCFELNLDDILLRPGEWQASVAALQRRVESRRGPAASTRSTDPAVVQDASSLAKELSKSRLLTKILITKISGTVTRLLQDTLPEDDHFNPISIYKFLRQNYSISEEMKQFQENPETNLLELFSKK